MFNIQRLKRFLQLAGVTVTVLMLSVCENPFQAGLGDTVDLDRPEITLSSPTAGTVLRGAEVLRGRASDDKAIQQIEVSFDRGVTWKTVLTGGGTSTDWSYELDTTLFSSGSFRIMLRITDASGKSAVSEEIVYSIDNDSPRLILTFPVMDPDDPPSSKPVDYWTNIDVANPPELVKSVGKGGNIYGNIADKDAVGEAFPQYMFWKRGDTSHYWNGTTEAWVADGDDDWVSVDNAVGADEIKDAVDFKIPVPSKNADTTDASGEYLLKLRGQDIGGQEIILGPFLVNVVAGAPVVEVVSPSQNAYVRNTLTLTGTVAHEGNDRPTLTLGVIHQGNESQSTTINDGALTTGGPTTVDGNNQWTWEYNLDTTGFDDGTVTIEVDAIVESGDSPVPGFGSVSMNIDNTKPQVSFSGPSSGSEMNQTVEITGVSSDNYLIDQVEYRVFDTDTPATTYIDWTPMTGNLTGWAFDLDTVTDVVGIGGGSKNITLEVRSTDKAGTLSDIASRTFVVDQDSDFIDVSFANLDPDAASAAENTITKNTDIIVNLNDDDGADLSTLQYRYAMRQPDSSYPAFTSWRVVDEDSTNTDKIISGYEVLLNKVGTDEVLDDGVYKVQFWAEDVNGLGLGRTGQNTDALEVILAVSSGPPTITQDAGIHNSYHNDTFTISGSVEDLGAGVDFVKLMLDGSQIGDPILGDDQADANNFDFSFSVDPEAGHTPTDTAYNFDVVAQNYSGQESTKTYTINIDRGEPSTENFTVTPIVNTNDVNGTISFSVLASDDNGLQDNDPVKYWFLSSTDSAPTSYDDADGTSFGTSPYADTLDTTALAGGDGNYVLYIIVRDRAGNDKVISRALTVDQTSDAPAVVFTEPADSNPNSGTWDDINALPVSFSGTTSDDDGIASISWKLPTETTWTEIASWTTNYPKSYSWNFSLDGVGDGTGKTFEIQVVDSEGETTGYNSVETSSPAFNILTDSPQIVFTAPTAGDMYKPNDSVTLSGSVTPAAATTISSLKYKVGSSGSYAAVDTYDSGTGSWSQDITIPAGASEGILRLYVQAVGSNSNSSTETLEVIVDATAPVTTFTKPDPAQGTPPEVNGEYVLTGGSTDNRTVDYAKLEVFSTSSPGSPELTVPDIGNYSWTYTLNTTDLTYDNEDYTLRVTTYDSAGNSHIAEEVISINQSLDVPGITFSNLNTDGSSYLPASGDILGTATDDDGVDSIKVKYDGGSFSTIELDGGKTEPLEIPFGLSGEGAHTITIEVVDTEGFSNGTKEFGPYSFTVDSEAPTMEVSSPLYGSSHNTKVTFTGTSSDANGLAKVEYRIADGGWIDVTDAAVGSFNAGTGDWSVEIPFDDLDAAKDSDPTLSTVDLSFRVTDNSGEDTIKNWQIVIDTEPPSTVTMTDPDGANGTAVNRDVVLTGSAADDLSDIASITLNAVDPNDFSLTQIVQMTTDLAPWSYTLDTTQFTEGGGSFEDYATDNGDGTYTVTLRVVATDEGGNSAPKDVSFDIDQSLNIPEVSINNIPADYFPDNTGTINGTVEDDDGLSTLEYSYDGGSTWNDILPAENVGDTDYSFALPLSGLSDGAYTLEVRVSDTEGGLNSTVTASDNFIIDSQDPSISISSPADNAYFKDTFTITGTISDANGIGVDNNADGDIEDVGDVLNVTAWIDGETPVTASVSTSDGSSSATSAQYTVDLEVTGLDQTNHRYYLEVTDGVGKTYRTNQSFTYDITPPELEILTPDSGVNVNGRVSIRGTASDSNSGIMKTEYKIGNNQGWQEFTNALNLEKEILNIGTYGNATDAILKDGSTNIWYLPIYFRATDNAQNVTTFGGYESPVTDNTYYMTVDPEGDNPESVFLQPLDLETVGGRIRLSGSASDDDAVYQVEVAFDMDGNGSFNDPGDLWPTDGVPGGEQQAPLTQVANPSNPGETYEDSTTTAWYVVNDNSTSGSWSNWSLDINKYGEFNPSIGDKQPIKIKTRAIDMKTSGTPDLAGNEEIITITIDSNVPTIEGINYLNGDIIGGSINLEGTVKDTTEIDFLSIKISGNGNTNTHILINNSAIQEPAWVTDEGAADGEEFSFSVPIDTVADYYADGDSGLLSFTLEAVDDTGFPTQQFFDLKVDNQYPTIAEDSLNLDTITVDSTTYYSMLGTEYYYQGSATDSGTVSGLDKVVLFFQRGNDVFNIDENVVSEDSTSLVDADSALTGNTYVIASLGDTDFTTIGAPRNEVGVVFTATGSTSGTTGTLVPEGYFAVIDQYNEEGDDNGAKGDDDDILENLSLSGSGYSWYVRFDSYMISDGPVTISQTAIDEGGNAATTTVDAFAANKKPEIQSIDLGTALIAGGVVDEVQSFIDGGYTTDFTVRNEKFFIETFLQADTNTISSYVIEYNDTDAATPGWIQLNSGSIGNSTYTVEDFSVIADAEKLDGDTRAQFKVTVTDNLNLSDIQVFEVYVDNNDELPPTLDIAPFGQRYTNPDTFVDTDKALESVDDYTENLVTVGRAVDGEKLGYVQYAGAGHSGDTKPDLSGKVIFTGKAYDNQQIGSITVSIPGYIGNTGDTAGDAFTVAQWQDATDYIVPVTNDMGGSFADVEAGTKEWAFEIIGDNAGETESQNLSEADGHVLNWRFIWDTASLPNKAQEDLAIKFNIADAAAQEPATTPDMTVDVVPYITEIERGTFNTNRSKYGKYPIQQDESGIIIRGFNLDGGTAVIENTAGTLSDSVYLTASGSQWLLNTSLESDGSTVIDVHSGYLVVTVNTVDSINNSNSDTAEYNKIDDGNGIAGTLWKDDIYFDVWQTGGSFPDSNGNKHPAMEISSNGTLYGSWSNYVTSSSYYATEATSTYIHGSYDPNEWTDIVMEGTATPHVVYLRNQYNNGDAWGGLTVYDNGTNEIVEDLGDDASWNTDKTDGMDEYLYQFQNPRIAFNDNLNYVSYYDDFSKSLKIAITNGGTATLTTAGQEHTSGDTVIDGEDFYQENPNFTENVGLWSDIQIDTVGETNDRPVVVYYSTTDKSLKLARGQNATPQNGEWTFQDVLADDSFVGTYVSLKFDSTGRIHISAYKSSTGELRYLSAPNVNGNSTYAFDVDVVVDEDGAVGSWSDMELNGTNPMVGYMNNAMLGTSDGVKVAYYDTTESDWEYMIVPAETPVYDGRISLVYDDGNDNGWDYAVGFKSDNFDIAKHIPEE